MDQMKRKRMQSNRESARRSRMKKQQHLDELNAQVTQLQKENEQIVGNINLATQNFLNVEAENSVLRAQMMELSQSLQSLNEILNCMNSSNGILEMMEIQDNPDCFMNNSWNLMYHNQPIMVSDDMFHYY